MQKTTGFMEYHDYLTIFYVLYVLKNECRSTFALTYRGHEVNMCSSVDKHLPSFQCSTLRRFRALYDGFHLPHDEIGGGDSTTCLQTATRFRIQQVGNPTTPIALLG